MVVKVLKVNDIEYQIIQLLGKGKGGYSYLVTNGVNQFVLKQIHHESCEYYQFGNKLESEIKDYNRLNKLGIKLPKLIDFDIKNERILKEFIDGDTIYELVLQDRMLNVFFDQMISVCDVLYKSNTNIDYFPTNFIVKNSEIYYIDFECNDYMEEWDFKNWGIKYWTKTPEFLKYVNEQHKNKNSK